jgi:hypothetical protein
VIIVILVERILMTKSYETKDSGKRVDYKSGMRRDTQENKPRYDLIYLPMLTRFAELLSRGAAKYGERNWQLAKTEEERNRFKASAFRHFIQWMNNEDDEDHASAIWFNVMACEYMKDNWSSEVNEGL